MEFDFSKHGTVDTLDTVPETYRGLYAEAAAEDGKKVFKISDAAKGIVEAYTGTNGALVKARGDLKAANEESASRRVTKKSVLELAKGLGIEDVNEDEPIGSLKTFVDGLVEKVKGGADIKINLDKIKQDAEKRLAEAIEGERAKNVKMQGALERYLIDQQATSALAGAKGSVELLLPHVKAHTKVVADGEDYVVRVVDPQGDFRSDGKGGFMTVAGLVAEMKTQEAFGRAFESEKATGTGARPGSMERPVRRDPNADMSATDKIAAGLKKGSYGRGQ
jgi:hypothetical protein